MTGTEEVVDGSALEKRKARRTSDLCMSYAEHNTDVMDFEKSFYSSIDSPL